MVVRPLPSNLPLRTVMRSTRSARWGARLANKGLAAFQPASVTLSLACLCRSPWAVGPGHESVDSDFCDPSLRPLVPNLWFSVLARVFLRDKAI
jgi:hypothetical protein